MIVSCGEALVDLVPEAVPGGGPMNVAIAAARQATAAAFVGRISTDDHGRRIWDHLLANGVDLRAAERGPEATARAIVDVGPPLVFRFEGEGTADTMLAAADLMPLGGGSHLLHGGTLGLFRGQTAEVLAQLVEGHDGLVSLDPNIRPQLIEDRDRWDHFHQRWLAQADVFKASDEDVDWIWPGRMVASVADELLAGKARLVIVTKGSDGALLFYRDGHVTVPGRVVPVIDTVGAGDTFIATVLVSLMAGTETGGDPLDGLRATEVERLGDRAVAASALVCGRAGADPPSVMEIDALVAPASPD